MPSDLRGDLQPLFDHNRNWARKMREGQPRYFEKLAEQQIPKFLWIGCSDSRVPANEIIGLQPGEVFVHRNVANIISLTDFNCLATVQYAVEILKVVHIIVCGHYGCGGVHAAIAGGAIGLVNNWLSPISEAFETYREEIEAIENPAWRVEKLCEINVILQVRNLCRSALLRDAWGNGRELAVHGLIYGIQDGILRDLQANIVSRATAEAVCHIALRRILATPGRVVA
ncbi:MAG TPA: carbonic anhydrase [Terrimicrobiaceae bacterium]|jgi:carbonic anhydrase|nr:carbonic anhydrase [Terrimicrobiaceae bacterium]